MFLLQTTSPNLPPVNINDSIKNATEAAIQQIRTNPQAFLEDLGHDALMFAVKVLVALIIYFLGAWIISKVNKLQKRRFQRRKTDPTVASFVSSATKFGLTLLLIIITIGTLGVDTTSLAALLAAGGMAIGMALSGTVQNFAGGIMIVAFRPFKVGDWISAQNYQGTVTSVSIVNTKIRTADNREVILPNGILSNGVIDNYSALDLRRIDLTISVEYGTDAQECIDLLLSLLKADERILDSSTKGANDPMVVLKSMNDNDISFAVRGFVKNADFWDVTFSLNKIIYTELPKHNIQFAYPHMDVTLLNNK